MWIYNTIHLNGDISRDELLIKLNKQGSDGWELVQMIDFLAGLRSFVFKKSIEQGRYTFVDLENAFMAGRQPTLNREPFNPIVDFRHMTFEQYIRKQLNP